MDLRRERGTNEGEGGGRAKGGRANGTGSVNAGERANGRERANRGGRTNGGRRAKRMKGEWVKNRNVTISTKLSHYGGFGASLSLPIWVKFGVKLYRPTVYADVPN